GPVRRSSGGEKPARPGRDERRPARRDEAETDGDEPNRRWVLGDGGDRSRDEKNDVIVVVVIVEARNPPSGPSGRRWHRGEAPARRPGERPGCPLDARARMQAPVPPRP